MINPCRSCDLALADKNNGRCLKCERRVQYVAALEGTSHSVPVEMTDMARQPAEKTKTDDQFLRDHPDMPASQIAKELGRSVESIYVRRSTLKKRGELIRQRHAGMKSARDRGPKLSASDGADLVVKPMTSPAPAEIVRSKDFMLVNVDGHEDLYERLVEHAKKEFRTPELQALYFISKALEGGA